MKTGSLVIESAGPFCAIQDAGRYAYQRYGMPVSGAMDLYALQLANGLVGNPPGGACLETTLIGVSIRFKDSARIAICGADMQPFVNDRPVRNNAGIEVQSGDLLHFGGLRTGCRAYIAVGGDFDIAPVMGSKSTYLRAGIGGFKGRALQDGDVLCFGKTCRKPRIEAIPDELLVNHDSVEPVRIIPGPEIKMFDFDAVLKLLTTPYTVSLQCDRMGYRLEGEPLKPVGGKADILSSGIPMGTVQVPGDGQPIIMMADRQTTGGYARMAVVASVDLKRVAQLKPGDPIRFCEIGMDEAQTLFAKRQQALASLFERG